MVLEDYGEARSDALMVRRERREALPWGVLHPMVEGSRS
jgi:hypothetical protein